MYAAKSGENHWLFEMGIDRTSERVGSRGDAVKFQALVGRLDETLSEF